MVSLNNSEESSTNFEDKCVEEEGKEDTLAKLDKMDGGS
jgi:hypothetical protein